MPQIQRLDGIHIQPRDVAILCGLYESRFLTAFHVAEIFFEGRREMAKKRIQRLKCAGLIHARSRGFGISQLLCLTAAGIRFLGIHGHLSPYPQLPSTAQLRRTRIQPLTIDHELAVADVKAAFSRAIRERGTLSLREFGTWPRLYEFESVIPPGNRVTVAPDGFLRIGNESGDETRFFVEVDRSTESTSVLLSRVAAYRRFYRSGGFAARLGLHRGEYARAPFRVLVVCKSAARRASISRAIRSVYPQIRTFVLLSTSDDVSQDALGAIWLAPIDAKNYAALRSLLESQICLSSTAEKNLNPLTHGIVRI